MKKHYLELRWPRPLNRGSCFRGSIVIKKTKKIMSIRFNSASIASCISPAFKDPLQT